MQLFFRQYGSGKPVIILHGLFGQSDNWITVARRMAGHFSVFIPDLRNHGQSPRSPLLSYPAMADDLQEFIEDHQLADPILIGHSMGGKVAMTYTLEHPDMIAKLVIIDISPRKYPERNIHSQVLTYMLDLDLEAIKTRSEAEKILSGKIQEDRIRMFILKNLYYKLPGHLAWRLNLDAIAGSLDGLFEGITAEGVFTHPTLFIRGGLSDYIQDSDIPRIKSLFPAAQIALIPAASHWVHSDAPKELCKVLSLFLEKECDF
jgi:esterase